MIGQWLKLRLFRLHKQDTKLKPKAKPKQTKTKTKPSPNSKTQTQIQTKNWKLKPRSKSKQKPTNWQKLKLKDAYPPPSSFDVDWARTGLVICLLMINAKQNSHQYVSSIVNQCIWDPETQTLKSFDLPYLKGVGDFLWELSGLNPTFPSIFIEHLKILF